MKRKIIRFMKSHPILFYVPLKIVTWFYNERHKQPNILEKNTRIGKNSHVTNSYFGYASGCNFGCNINSAWIGRYVNIAPNVTICPRDHIYENFTTHDMVYKAGEHIRQYTVFEDVDEKCGGVWRCYWT